MRASIRAELAQITPLDTLEQAQLSEALVWVDSGAELVRRIKPDTPPRHLVSYFAVANAHSMLLVDHKNAQLWLPPGGHVEPQEHPRATVARELSEELGFAALSPIGPPLMVTCTETVGLTSGHTDVCLWYLIEAEPTQPMRFDESEFHAVRWFNYTDMPFERADRHLKRFVQKLLARFARLGEGANR